MKKNELLPLLNTLGIAPSKRMGQNFLVDDRFSEWIVREAHLQPGDNVLEVGPGLGAITSLLVRENVHLTAIEFDRKLAEYMRKMLVPKGLNLIEGDACRVDVPHIFGPDQDFCVVSNLPYSAGTVFVANLLDLERPPKSLFIMLQKEVAERFAAQPGTDEYSALTIRLQAAYRVELVRIVPPEVFFPKPEIDSAVIRMTLRDDVPDWKTRIRLSRLVRTSFAHRRKKMFKQAAAVFGADEIRAAMEGAGVDPDVRAERVSVEQFLRMTRLLSGKREGSGEEEK